MPKVDRHLVQTPKIKVGQEALMQLDLILKNDPTLAGPYFRIIISGKGCDGFTYQTYFDGTKKDDFIIELTTKVKIVMDPFCAYYLQNGTLEYAFDDVENIEGFIVTNLDQDKFQLKFWRKNEELTPPLIQD